VPGADVPLPPPPPFQRNFRPTNGPSPPGGTSASQMLSPHQAKSDEAVQPSNVMGENRTEGSRNTLVGSSLADVLPTEGVKPEPSEERMPPPHRPLNAPPTISRSAGEEGQKATGVSHFHINVSTTEGLASHRPPDSPVAISEVAGGEFQETAGVAGFGITGV
ncbi:unnamed protein product, partial [Laminaria digitata]